MILSYFPFFFFLMPFDCNVGNGSFSTLKEKEENLFCVMDFTKTNKIKEKGRMILFTRLLTFE